MSIEQTCFIIKPNAVAKNVIGSIIQRLECIGLIIIGIKMIRLNRKQAEEFYLEHKHKSFFTNLIRFMISGPVLLQVLEGEDAVRRTREIIGSTNPDIALTGTLRADYADGLIENAIHGSDSAESAKREINFFFKRNEIHIRNS